MHATKPFSLETRLVRPETLAGKPGGRLLGVVAYGAGPVEIAGAPVVRVPLGRLDGGGEDPAIEVWRSAGPESPVLVERRGAVELARDRQVLFGHLRAPAAGTLLEPAAFDAYREVLAATEGAGYPHLLRVWASVPSINRREDGLERYQAFCRARAAAFEEAWGSVFTGRLPASTAVGSEERSDEDPAAADLVIHFLAACAPGVHVENPRQVAAYEYPGLYGPSSPSFARATRTPPELGGLLFVSGTASILGHASVHQDLAEQTRETVRNLERVREAAEAGGRRLVWSLFKVYLRRREDEAEARRLLAALLPTAVPTLFLRADVCRRELLVEIEAVARRE